MIGLIFGGNNFPLEILKKIKKKKLKYLIIDLSKSKKFKKDKNSYNVSNNLEKLLIFYDKIAVITYYLQEKLLNQIFQNLN